MAGAGGLIRYVARRVLPGSGEPGAATQLGDRPGGPLVWMHIGKGSRASAVHEIGRRIVAVRDGLSILITTSEPGAPPVPPPLLAAPSPGDSVAEVRAFLSYWAPDAAVLTGMVTYPNALLDLGEAGIPVCLSDATLSQSALRSLRWTPGVRRSVFSRIACILTATHEDAEDFASLGIPTDRIEAVGALGDAALPLPANDAELADLAGAFAGRPTWLAVGVPRDEEEAVIGAHQRASELSHRLLLVLVPSDPARGLMLASELDERGWRVALRSDGDEPDATCQVYIADTEGEDGLWYRLCPVTYLGGTMTPGPGPGRDPGGPAALGSAILTGPESKGFRERTGRFLARGAARTVGTGAVLGDAVAELLAPDKAAEMASRAWDVTSDGAAATDRLIAFVEAALDEGRER